MKTHIPYPHRPCHHGSRNRRQCGVLSPHRSGDLRNHGNSAAARTGEPTWLLQLRSNFILKVYALQAVGRNRKECKELARLAESVTSAVVDAASDVQEELDEKLLLNLAELEWCVEKPLSSISFARS